MYLGPANCCVCADECCLISRDSVGFVFESSSSRVFAPVFTSLFIDWSFSAGGVELRLWVSHCSASAGQPSFSFDEEVQVLTRSNLLLSRAISSDSFDELDCLSEVSKKSETSTSGAMLSESRENSMVTSR